MQVKKEYMHRAIVEAAIEEFAEKEPKLNKP